MSKTKYISLSGEGIPCPRCGNATSVRGHTLPLSEKIQAQPFYYTKWFYCYNTACKTEIFFSEQFKVWNKNKSAESFKNVEEDQATLEFIKNLK